MKEASPVTISRKDYQAPVWTIDRTDLHFELEPSLTVVTSVLHLRQIGTGPLNLDGKDLALKSISVNGETLDAEHYTLTDQGLEVNGLPSPCQLCLVTHITPDKNTALEGLYCSGGHLTTQCESEGFRKITYYLDRPDVLSVFNVEIVADKTSYPVLLSNGNQVSSEDIANNRHKVVWHDPFPKPCYLFALVAGQLSCIKDTFTTRSKREVDLHIYVEEHNLDQCAFAMDALKRSMLWDEQVYGLEYDLDLFMIVVVDDFNAGAMENKGLNIFNSKYVLADTQLATDNDFLGVEAVIAHEYFHNWTGNRVTCRDWFQLSLKEGLTVFRDQQFSSDMRSVDVKRIQDVKLLREHQFAEDASPMSHPIRPDEYIEINNFYTLTVYEKGAEVIRMIHTLLGAKNYYKGIDLYFERYDGQAVTCDDFVQAMQDASGVDLSLFIQWYSQSGTPKVIVSDSYDENKKQYTLSVKQSNPDREGTPRPALHIPLSVGLLDTSGAEITLSETDELASNTKVLHVTQTEQQFHFENVLSKPVPSLLRGFSAPVSLEYNYRDQELALLLANDTDSFNRWEAAQRLAMRIVDSGLDRPGFEIPSSFVDAFEPVLRDELVDAGFKSLLLQMPSIKTVSNHRELIDVQAFDKILHALKSALAIRYQPILEHAVTNTAQRDDINSIGPRMLANAALSLLSNLPAEQWLTLAETQYDNATNMTDRVAALGVMCNEPSDITARCLSDFYNKYSSHKLVVDKWFSLQAGAQHVQVVSDVIGLTQHSAFSLENPNRLRSLVGAFGAGNPLYFHSVDGSGYRFLTDMILRLNSLNPQVAARLVTPFLQWRRYVEPQQQLMKAELQTMADAQSLSPAVFEVVDRALNN